MRQSLTVKLLNGQTVVHGKPEAINVSHRTLVIWPHNGRIRGGMGQTQRMAELMHRNREQVCAAAVT